MYMQETWKQICSTVLLSMMIYEVTKKGTTL